VAHRLAVAAVRAGHRRLDQTPAVGVAATNKRETDMARVRAAALDVYEEEPKIHPDLLPLENVLLVPHLGSGTTETRTAMADLAVSNVVAVLSGQPPITPIV
jgi:phosphoglycerate dehydrogenase-like enzyme